MSSSRAVISSRRCACGTIRKQCTPRRRNFHTAFGPSGPDRRAPSASTNALLDAARVRSKTVAPSAATSCPRPTSPSRIARQLCAEPLEGSSRQFGAANRTIIDARGGGQEEDGTDTILDFDCAMDDGSGGYTVVDVVEIDASTFGDAGNGDDAAGTGIFDDGDAVDQMIEAVTLADYLSVTSGGVLQADLDGAGGEDPVDIVDVSATCGDGNGVAVEINDQTFVWDAGTWVEVVG